MTQETDDARARLRHYLLCATQFVAFVLAPIEGDPTLAASRRRLIGSTKALAAIPPIRNTFKRALQEIPPTDTDTEERMLMGKLHSHIFQHRIKRNRLCDLVLHKLYPRATSIAKITTADDIDRLIDCITGSIRNPCTGPPFPTLEPDRRASRAAIRFELVLALMEAQRVLDAIRASLPENLHRSFFRTTNSYLRLDERVRQAREIFLFFAPQASDTPAKENELLMRFALEHTFTVNIRDDLSALMYKVFPPLADVSRIQDSTQVTSVLHELLQSFWIKI